MGLSFFKRLNLFGGLGVNMSKSGPSFSVRTKFGSVGPRGVSIRTGIPGLTLRFKNLSEKMALSEKRQAILLIQEELEHVTALGEQYTNDHTQFKRWNGMSLEYPSENYETAFAELSALFDQGKDIREYLHNLVALASEHRTGLTKTLRGVLAEFDKLHLEVGDILHKFVAFKEQEIRKSPSPAIPPAIQAEDQTQFEETVRFNCHQCQQPLELNRSANGQGFNCPSCGSYLVVP